MVRKNMTISMCLAALFIAGRSRASRLCTQKNHSMTDNPKRWSDRLREYLPTRQALSEHPWLRPVAQHLLAPRLWCLQHEAVARGVAIGTFWAFVIPLGQTFAAAVHCTWWRGNIPAAALMTMLTNPLTFGFWLWLAYQLGALVMGEPPSLDPTRALGTAGWLAEFGWPTALGMALFAVGGAALGYFGVKVIWRLRTWHKRAGRVKSRLKRSPSICLC
jgi:uncharacterized protein (DUF2062 family)